jgi:hypothetical protein
MNYQGADLSSCPVVLFVGLLWLIPYLKIHVADGR